MNEAVESPVPLAGEAAGPAAVAEVPASPHGGWQMGSVLAVSDTMVGRARINHDRDRFLRAQCGLAPDRGGG